MHDLLSDFIPCFFSLNILIFLKLKDLNVINQELCDVFDLIVKIDLSLMSLLVLAINYKFHGFHSLLEYLYRANIIFLRICLFLLDFFKCFFNHGIRHIDFLSIRFVLIQKSFLNLPEILYDFLLGS